MATEIDKRVVEMQFDNKDFEKNCKETLSTLDKLKMALNFDGAKGLKQVGEAAKKVDLSNISKGAEAVSVKFSVMQIAGMTAISELTKGLLNFGKNIWNNTFGQMSRGGFARTLKIDQANFQMRALANNFDEIAGDAEKLAYFMQKMGDSIDKAVTGTAYGYDAAAAVASQLMASGIKDMDDMYNHLRAIAGAASMTGSSFEEIGHIFTRIASNGRVMGDDLQSFSSRGLNLTAALGKELGKTEAQVREMIKKGQIDFQKFSDTLYNAYGEAAGKADETWAGVTANVKAQLSRIGQIFTDPIVKYLIPVLASLKGALKEINKIIKPMQKVFVQFWSKITKSMKDSLDNLNIARLKVIANAVENIFSTILLILNAVRQAFAEVFPKKTSEELYDAAKSFENITQALFPTKETLEGIKNIVKVLLVPLRLMYNIFRALSESAIKPIAISLIKFAASILKIINTLEPFISALLDTIVNSRLFNDVLLYITATIVSVINALSELADIVSRVFTKLFKNSAVNQFLDGLQKASEFIRKVISFGLYAIFYIIQKIFSYITVENITSIFKGIWNVISFFIYLVQNAISTVGQLLKGASESGSILGNVFKALGSVVSIIVGVFKGEDVSDKLTTLKESIIGVGKGVKQLFADLMEAIRGIDTGKLMLLAFGAAIVYLVLQIAFLVRSGRFLIDSIEGTVGILRKLKNAFLGIGRVSPVAQLLFALTLTIGTLTAALVTLSNDVDPERLKVAAASLGALVAALMGFSVAMTILTSKSTVSFDVGIKSFLVLMMSIAGSIWMLSTALKALTDITFNWEQFKGPLLAIIALIVSMGAVVAGINALSGPASGNLSMGAIAILAFAASIKILASVLIALSDAKIYEKAKDAILAIISIIFLLGTLSLSIATISMAGGGLGSGLAMIGIALSLLILISVLKKIANVPADQIKEGFKRLIMMCVPILGFIVAMGVLTKVAGAVGFLSGLGGTFAALTFLLITLSSLVILLGSMNLANVMVGLFVVNALGKLLSNLINKIIMTMSQVNPSAIATAQVYMKNLKGFIIGLGAAMLMLAISTRIVDGVSLLSVLEVGLLLGVLGEIALRFTTLSKETEHAKIGPIIAMITALSAMMGALAILSFQDPGHIIVAATSMAIVIGAVIGMMALINKLQDTGNKIIATTSKAPFKKSKLAKTIAITVGIIAGITLFMTVIATALGNLAKTANEVVTNNMATQIALLGTEVGTKPDATTQNLAAFGPLGILLGATVGLIVIAGLLYKMFDKIAKTSSGNLMQKAAMLASIASIIVLCVGAVSVLGMVQSKLSNPTDILFAGIALSLSVVALAAVIAAMSKIPSNQAFNSIKVAAALAVAAGAMLILALAITPLAIMMSKDLVNWNDILVSAGVLALVVLAIGETMKTIMKANKKGTGSYMKAAISMVIACSALLVIAASVGALGYALTQNAVSLDNLAAALVVIGLLAVLVFVTLGIITEKTAKGSKGKPMKAALAMVVASSAILIIAASIGLIGLAVKDAQSTSALITALAFFIGVVVVLGILLGVLAAISSKIDTGKLILATAAFAILAGSISVIALVIAGLAKVSKDMNGVNFDKIMSQLSKILGIFAKMMVVGGVIAAIPVIGHGVLIGMLMIYAAFAIFSAGVALLAKAALSFAQVVDTIVDDFIKLNEVHIDSLELSHNIRAIKKIAPQVAEAFVAIVHEVIKGIGAITYEIVDLGMTFTMGFLQGINNQLPEILDTFLEMMKTIADFLGNEENMGVIESFCEKIGEVLFTVITGILSGLFKEINNEIDKLQDKYFNQQNEDLHKINNQYTSKQISDRFLKYYSPFESMQDIFEKQGMGQELLEKFLTNPSGLSELMKSDILDYENFTDEMKKDIAAATELRRKQGITDDEVLKQLINHMKGIAELNGIAYDSDEIKDYGAKMAKLIGISDLYSKKTGYINRVMQEAAESEEELADKTEEASDKIEKSNKKVQDSVKGTADAVEEANDKVEKEGFFDGLIKKGTEMFGGSGGFFDALKNAASEGLGSLTGLFSNIGDEFGKEFNISFEDGAFNNLDLTTLWEAITNQSIDEATIAGWAAGKSYRNAFFESQEAEMDYYLKEANKSVFVGSRSASGAPNAGGKYSKYWETLTDEKGNKLYKSAEDYANKQYEAQHAYDATSESVNALGIAYEDAAEAVEEFDLSSQTAADNLEETKDKYKEFTDSLRDSVKDALSNIFDDPGEMEILDPDKILDNMWENLRRVGQWSRQISELARRGISEPLLNELKEMGPQGAATVDAFARMTTEQLQEANRLYQHKLTMPDAVTNSITKSYQEAGFNASLGFANGIDPNAANQAMIDLANNGLDALTSQEGLNCHSPSRKTYEIGQNATLGLANGVKDSAANRTLYYNSLGLGDKVVKAIEVFLKISKAVEIGTNFCNGLAAGFVSGGQNVVNKASALANAIYQTFIRKFLIHSPSKVMADIGEYIMMGLGNGIDDGSTYVERQTGESVDNIIDSMKENLYGILDNVGEDGVYQPVIRPVFDMTALDQGWNDINSWFANSQGINLNSNISRLTPTTYDQNNDQAIVDAINNIDTGGIKNEIQAMRTDISTLQTAITNMQVVMNTGALVGQLMNPLDSALGQKAMLNNRGRY